MIDDFIHEAEREIQKLRADGVSSRSKAQELTQKIFSESREKLTKSSLAKKIPYAKIARDLAVATTPILKKALCKTGTLDFAVSTIPVLKGVLDMANVREDFLTEGKQYLENMLGTQAEYQIGLKYDKDLAGAIQSDINILSDEIESNSKLAIPIRRKVQQYSEEAKKYIFLTAALIEKQRFEDFDGIIQGIKAGESEKQKIELLLGASQLCRSGKLAIEISTTVKEDLRNIG
jgi:hypothetical protein